MVVVVNYGQSGAGSVCCSNGRYDYNVLSAVVCGSLCCINGAAAAYGYYRINVVLLYDSLHLIYFAVAGYSAEYLVTSVVVKTFKALFYFIMTGFVATV